MPTSLARKLKLKPGARAAILNAPDGYAGTLDAPEGDTIDLDLEGSYDWIQVFARTKKDLDVEAPRAAAALRPDGMLWLSFPKGSSGMQTDLTRDRGWDVLESLDLKWVTLVSVDSDWSAFGLRPFREGEDRTSIR